MPNQFYESLEPGFKIQFTLTNGLAAMNAYERLMAYRDAAAVQLHRLREAEALSLIGTKPEGRELADAARIMRNGLLRIRAMLYETNFYFIAWTNCGRFLEVLTSAPEAMPARKVFSQHRHHFKHYSEARNCFEHYDERLPGRKNERKLKAVPHLNPKVPSQIHYAFDDGKFRHSDGVWDISGASLDLLNSIIDETLAALFKIVDERAEGMFLAPPGVATGDTPPDGTAAT